MKLWAIRKYNKAQQERYFLKTGFNVDISQLGKNTSTITRPLTPSLEEIRPGVWLSTGTTTFPDGNFTNIYDLFWDSKNPTLTPYIHSAKKPFYLFDFIKKSPSIFAVINGSFFFLVDNKESVVPKDSPFHFCIREGRIIGLLSSDEAVVYIQEGELHAQELKARGRMQIGNKIISWVGSSHNAEKRDLEIATLYNSGSARIVKSFDQKTGVRNGFLDTDHIRTPKNPEVFDLIIDIDKSGNLFVKKIKQGGDTHYFTGLMILQITGSNDFRAGDLVKPIMLDSLKLSGISSAITVNKSVQNPYFYTPERVASRDARSVIAQDISGNIHFIVFDGSKYIPMFKGVSANDVSSYFPKNKFKWAYFLDGGSSSRIITRKKRWYDFLANDFAFRRIGLDRFLWDSRRHRKLASLIALKVNTVN